MKPVSEADLQTNKSKEEILNSILKDYKRRKQTIEYLIKKDSYGRGDLEAELKRVNELINILEADKSSLHYPFNKFIKLAIFILNYIKDDICPVCGEKMKRIVAEDKNTVLWKECRNKYCSIYEKAVDDSIILSKAKNILVGMYYEIKEENL